MIDINNYPKIIDEVYKDNLAAKQVLLTHSLCVAKKALNILKNKHLALDEKFIFEGAMLHDIGIIGTNAKTIFCYGDKPYLLHGVLGAQLLEGTEFAKYKNICLNHCGVGLRKDEVIALGIGTEAMEPQDMNEMLIAYADNFYSKSSIETLDVELTIQEVVKNLSRFGNDKVETFYKFNSMFE